MALRTEVLVKGNHYLLLHQPQIERFLVSLHKLDLESYFLSSALVSGNEWLASISKMLLTKTLGLKKTRVVQHGIVQKV